MDKGYFLGFLFIATFILAILLIIDSVLFFGSICRIKVVLIIGMGFDAIAILSFIGIVFLSLLMAQDSSNMWKFIGIAVSTLTTVGFGFKCWTFLTLVGALQEMMLGVEPDNSVNMSDLQP